MYTLAMFPLGSVLLPTMLLPLHVFEPRYRAMVVDCLAGHREFGVCLIERGSEVGGGDLRSDVGTVAQIIDAQQLDDGRWVLAAVGTRRVRVLRWLEDDPYPRAEVEDWLDDAPADDVSEVRDRVVARMRQVLALAAELGDPAAPATIEIDIDAVLAGYQVTAVSPIGAFDQQRLLGAASPAQRLAMLDEFLLDEEVVLRQRMSVD